MTLPAGTSVAPRAKGIGNASTTCLSCGNTVLYLSNRKVRLTEHRTWSNPETFEHLDAFQNFAQEFQIPFRRNPEKQNVVRQRISAHFRKSACGRIGAAIRSLRSKRQQNTLTLCFRRLNSIGTVGETNRRRDPWSVGALRDLREGPRTPLASG